ncbi:FAD fmn-containing isoamyl alcohol oxidase [Xylariaceae sp. FL0804]|nr:FAD fmn-containing isoamyl alcohol oxidase [Xylariaceae sp. FL0804]
MTNDLVPALEAITPGGGAYLNEADFRQPDFQQVFYGDNYEKLLAIKDKYDPNQLFYGLTAVGSDRWEMQPDGKLCRIEN